MSSIEPCPQIALNVIKDIKHHELAFSSITISPLLATTYTISYQHPTPSLQTSTVSTPHLEASMLQNAVLNAIVIR
jgi:hypothetical protein